MGRKEGMVHVSMILQNQRVNSPNEVLRRGQNVKVKVMSMAGNRISLSMKDVDQNTGEDLSPDLREGVDKSSDDMRPPPATGANAISARAIGSNGSLNANDVPATRTKRLTSPELFEIKQLIAAGVLDPKEYPHFDERQGLAADVEVDEEVDIELVEEEPRFLKGQTSKSLNLSPIKVIKVPDGSLHRAALASASLAKERKELRHQKEEESMNAVPRENDQSWIDPMANPEDRQLIEEQRNVLRGKSSAVPEWKKKTMGMGTSFGKRTDLSIKEQRETLPIFTLREALVNAIMDNQILVTIGETGSGKTTVIFIYCYLLINRK